MFETGADGHGLLGAHIARRAYTTAATEAMMQTNPIFDEESRDGQLARALNVALHTLSVHDQMHGTMEGESVTLDFGPQIKQIRAALKILGVGVDEILPFQYPEG